MSLKSLFVPLCFLIVRALAIVVPVEFGPNIQKYEVQSIPDVNFPMPQSWSGYIPLPSRGNDSLFFWLFKSEANCHRSNDLIIWLNGGPGCSSLGGATQENGPLHFPGNATLPQPNPYSWTKLANVLYIDQPVGTGFTFGNEPAHNNDLVVEDFYSFLVGFFTVFSGLKNMNIYLMGESYAGVYIPYFADKILKNKATLPLNLKSISLGDPTVGNYAAMSDVTVTQYLRTTNLWQNIPKDIQTAFQEADERCGFNGVLAQLQYPPHGKIQIPGNPEGENFKHKRQDTCPQPRPPITAQLARQSIDNYACWWGGDCATYNTWNSYFTATKPCYTIYNIGWDCNTAPNEVNFAAWLNKPEVKTALHARVPFIFCNSSILQELGSQPVSPVAYSLLPNILAQIPTHIYSGANDLLLNYLGAELVIQNMTWRGQQGFTQRPNKPFIVDGKQVGTWGGERGLTYHLFQGAGHTVPHDVPQAAFAFVRDFVLNTAYWGKA